MYKDKDSDFKYSMKVQIFKEDPVFGPGVVNILELVSQNNSLSSSYKIMGLSSSKGWKIIKRAEEDLGFPLIESSTGGRGGGHSYLTEKGKDILKKYNVFVEELNTQAEELFNKHFKR